MFKQYKTAFIISLFVSSVVTFSRMLKPNLGDFSVALGYFFYMLFLCMIYALLSQYTVKQKTDKIYYTVSFFILSGVIGIGYQHLIHLFAPNFLPLYTDVPLLEEMSKRQLNLLLFFRGISFTVFIYVVVYYLNVLHEKQQALLQIEQLNKEKLEAQLNSLKQQISPHFLFNSLSTLSSIVTDKSSKDYILKLSNVYRYLLGLKDENVATLEDELNFINSYLHILHERFEDGLRIKIDIDNTLSQQLLPPMALQLLIENAIKHNIVSLDMPLEVNIYTEDGTSLVVTNNLQPKITIEESTGKGLYNINKRYQLIANKSIELYKTETSFVVKIPLLNKNELNL